MKIEFEKDWGAWAIGVGIDFRFDVNVCVALGPFILRVVFS